MLDSSPQYHRDYEIVIVRTIQERHLATILEASWELERLWGQSLTEKAMTAANLVADLKYADQISTGPCPPSVPSWFRSSLVLVARPMPSYMPYVLRSVHKGIFRGMWTVLCAS